LVEINQSRPTTTMLGYRTKQEVMAITGVDDLIIRSLFDREQFADPLGEALRMGISSAMWPLFGLVWPSGLQLAAEVAARGLKPGERVLEIGCGLALASMVAHRHGADVTASDCHPLASSFLKANLRLNGLSPMKYRHGNWGSLLLPQARNSELSLRTVVGCYDFIIGSDILYERDDEALLSLFIQRHASPAAEVWVVDPDRSNRAAFSRQMADLGFSLIERRLDCIAMPGLPAYKGRLLAYRRG
jgi:predicted nicotinamide N-methyase